MTTTNNQVIQHSGRGHSELGPSSSERWLKCTPSAMLSAQFQDKPSVYAEEGTFLHELCELKLHRYLGDMQLVLSSSKLEDFIHFEGLPHLYNGGIISDALEATEVIKNVIFEESERRGRLLAEARVANIIEYNKRVAEKLAPIVVVIDEFADLSDQLESKKEKDAFFKPVQRIAQAGRSRGIHLVICTQRPEAKLVPPTTKAQLNGRVALRVNDGISSRMIIEASCIIQEA